MADKYAIIGNPIAHSRSPEIHAAFARQTGQNIEYARILGEPGRFAEAAQAFFTAGGRGLNATVPFKQDAWAFVDRRSPRAELAGAVNTLVLREDGELMGDNSDGVGLVRDLKDNHRVQLAGSRILLLGAGGAARGVLGPLLDQAPAEITLANRTAQKAVALAAAFTDLGPVSGCGLDALEGRYFDLVINATAAGLKGEVPPIPRSVFQRGGRCYDMMYGAGDTAFVSWARVAGAAQAVDGLGMLVEQAAESFYLWRGVRPATTSVIADLRASLAAAIQ